MNSSRTILRAAAAKKKKINLSASFPSGHFPTTTPGKVGLNYSRFLLRTFFICIKKCTGGREGGRDARPLACLCFKRAKGKPASLPDGKRKPNYAPLVLAHPHLRTRLPTQTRFPTPKEISRAVRGTSRSALFSRRGGEGRADRGAFVYPTERGAGAGKNGNP